MTGPYPAVAEHPTLQLTESIERADARIRLSCLGMRAADIEPFARALLVDLGVPVDAIRGYCEAMERGEAY
jgi:hypothetical protein